MKKAMKDKTYDDSPPSIPHSEIIEIDGLCKMLNVGKNTAYSLLTSGEIKAFKVGSVWKVPVDGVYTYIDQKCKEASRVRLYKVVNRNRDLFYEKNGRLPIMVK